MNDVHQKQRRVWRRPANRGKRGEAFDAERSRLQAENQYMRRSFEALMSISQSLGDRPRVETLFKQAIDPIQAITGFSTIALRLYDEKQRQFMLKACKGFSAEMLQILAVLPRPDADEYVERMIETKRAINYDVPITDSPIFRNVVFVPLIGNDRINGSMDLGSEAPRTWTEDEISWLELVGRYMGMVISQIQLLTRLEGLSIVQEREYIAQELHDDTVQAISAIMLWAQETGLDLDENRPDAARHAVQKIEQGANLAYKNLREEIFGLRHKIGPNDDILAVIQTFLDSFELRWGIHASLRVDNDPSLQSALQLPIRAETQVLRIIQEALTNVRKHARATSVEVYVRVTGEWLLFVVQDNGEGFEPQTVSPDHFGLRIMRERAASLGGTVNIDSRAGMGSWVEILIPR